MLGTDSRRWKGLGLERAFWGSRPVQSLCEPSRAGSKPRGQGQTRNQVASPGCHHPMAVIILSLHLPPACSHTFLMPCSRLREKAPDRTRPSHTLHSSSFKPQIQPLGGPWPSEGIRLKATQGSPDVLGGAQAQVFETLGVC